MHTEIVGTAMDQLGMTPLTTIHQTIGGNVTHTETAMTVTDTLGMIQPMTAPITIEHKQT
jgi:hypothetical protein